MADTSGSTHYSLKSALVASIAGITSYLPWVALSAVVTVAAVVILNSGMTVSDITHLLLPTAKAIGGLAA